jgi:hypothetical protein
MYALWPKRTTTLGSAVQSGSPRGR